MIDKTMAAVIKIIPFVSIPLFPSQQQYGLHTEPHETIIALPLCPPTIFIICMHCLEVICNQSESESD